MFFTFNTFSNEGRMKSGRRGGWLATCEAKNIDPPPNQKMHLGEARGVENINCSKFPFLRFRNPKRDGDSIVSSMLIVILG